MPSTALNFGRDSHSFNAYAPHPSVNQWSATLTNGSASSITLPALSNNQFWVVSYRYQPGTFVFVDVTGATAAIPVGATLATTTSEPNPASMTLPGSTTISVITSNTTAQIGIVAFQVGQS